MTIVRLCFDIGPGSGLGHRRRMEALAGALERRGTPGELVALDRRVEADVLVVDSYVHRADDTKLCVGRRVAAVDDLDRNLDVDLVIDPTGASGAGAAKRGATVLVGFEYALVDPGLSAWDPPRPTDEAVEEILVTAGGTDAAGLGARMAGTIAAALPEVTVRLVAGPWGSATVPDGVERVDGTAGISADLARAGIVVTAGGVTMLEAMRLGRPVIAVMTAENQRRYVETAQRMGAVEQASSENVAEVAAALARDPVRRRLLATRAGEIIDGNGPDRVAEVLLALV